MDPFTITFIRSSANLRTVLLTLLSWCLVSPAQGADSVTGVTTINVLGTFDAPCALVTDTVVALGLWAAPYGIAEASVGMAALTSSIGTFGLMGSADRSWVDLEPCWSNQWRVTSTYRIGATASARWMQANGFPSHLEGRLRLHAAADIDSAWVVGIGVDDLYYASTFEAEPLRALRIGLAFQRSFTVACDVALGSDVRSYIQLTFLTSIDTTVTFRISIRSEPLTTSIAVRLDDVVSVPITINAEYIQHVGLRSMLAVEFP